MTKTNTKIDPQIIEYHLDMLYGPEGGGSEKTLENLLELADCVDDDEFMAVFAQAWPDCDNTWSYRDELRHLLMYHCRADFLHHLSEDDLAFYNALPDEITVYRGCDASRVYGLSWTTDLELAKSFARGHRGMSPPNPVIACGMAAKKDLLFATNDRGESEVLVDRVFFSVADLASHDKIDAKASSLEQLGVVWP